MSNYTEADVKRWRDTLMGAVAFGFDGRTLAALDAITSAALEGAKVPGLVADNAALVSLLKRVSDAGFKLFGVLVADVEAVAAQPSQGAALLAEFEDVRAAWHRETERADALQARVAELERRDRNWRTHAETVEQERDTAESERDALRAQVDAVNDIASGVVLAGDSEEQDELAHRILAALSALSAETKGVKS